MTVDKIDLYEYFNLPRPKGAQGYLTVYVHDQSLEYCENRVRPAMLVIPGGGYSMVSDREGEPIALKYMTNGFNAFVLNYSVAPVGYPYQLIEGKMAVIYIRQNAKKYNIDENLIAGVGFSAGGHLLGMLSTDTCVVDVQKFLGDNAKYAVLNASVYSYPVVTIAKDFTHMGTRECLCGNDRDLQEKTSIENNVTNQSPPAFIWATEDDDTVPVENALTLALAYKKARVPFELHVYKSGIHGLSLATEEVSRAELKHLVNNPPVQTWFDMSVTFLKGLGFTVKL